MSTASSANQIGARLDRLRWSPAHRGILLALGAGWLFDSLEVSLFGSAVGPLGDHFHASTSQRDAVLAVWLGGILVGALVGGRLADRFGRRRLFVLTLVCYAFFTVLTGLSPDLTTVYVFRALAALGVGAEYAIVNSAIAEFMPARVRGKANAAVMQFWPAGAIVAGLVAYFALDTLALPNTTSWRYIFGVGGALALVVLAFRRRLPESPRWLASQGRLDEADAIVSRLEAAAGTTGDLVATAGIERSSPSFREALAELVSRYPGRLALGCLLDLAEAFGYYGIFALLTVVVLPKVAISQASIPFFYIVGNVGALGGGVAMTVVFDRLGRHRTVVLFYTLAAGGVALLAGATATRSAALVTIAFAVSSGLGTGAWTAAYPTFTELFPTHLRGAGVGASVGVGRIGAICGVFLLPNLATSLGATASYALVIVFWLVGVAAMVIYAARGGVDAVGRSLETVTEIRHSIATSPR
ncbi:MAG: MFS transporter [Actinomycetota bacterium]|nr:MFS transporter [Actinomycetota bacterium]